MFQEINITSEDFGHICRFCLAKQQAEIPIKFNPIFKENGKPVNWALLKMITTCIGFEVQNVFIFYLLLEFGLLCVMIAHR